MKNVLYIIDIIHKINLPCQQICRSGLGLNSHLGQICLHYILKVLSHETSTSSSLGWLSAKEAKSPMFTNVEATPLSGKRFVGNRQGISHQITRQTAFLLQGSEVVISGAEEGGAAIQIKFWDWSYGTPNFKLWILKTWKCVSAELCLLSSCPLPLFCGNAPHKTFAWTLSYFHWSRSQFALPLPECRYIARYKWSYQGLWWGKAFKQEHCSYAGLVELDFSGLAHGSCIVTPLPFLEQAMLSSENTPWTQECFINGTAPTILTGAQWGQRALHSQAINKADTLMKPNESPSIFPKQAIELRILKEAESPLVFEDKLHNGQKQNVMSKSSLCTTHNMCHTLRCWSDFFCKSLC